MNQDEIIAAVEKMTVVELNTLVKAIEEKWGVSATAVAAAGPAAGPAEEKSALATVKLIDKGAAPIQVIKVIKEALGLGLAEAKKLVDEAPSTLKEGMKREDAEELKKKLEAAGGKVELV